MRVRCLEADQTFLRVRCLKNESRIFLIVRYLEWVKPVREVVFFVTSQTQRRTTVVLGQTVEFHKIHFNSTKNTSANLTFVRNIFTS